MAIIMGALGYSISNMGGPATQVAAAQVASGMSLARQYAVAKNLETRFVICGTGGAPGDGLPPESWRYWTVIQTNRGSGKWTMLKEWEKLPAGVIFLNLAVFNYSPIEGDLISGAKLGETNTHLFQETGVTSGQEWKYIQGSAASLSIVVGNKNFTLVKTACLGFRADGTAVKGDGSTLSSGDNDPDSSPNWAAIRVARGVPMGNDFILKSTNDYYYVETDKRGRVRVRSPESFRQ